jgi:hypothetical protein
MGCADGISKNITSNCTTSKGGSLEVTAWIMNRRDVTVTYDLNLGNMITNLAMGSGTQAYKIVGTKKLLNAGHDAVLADDRPDKYTHYFNFQQFEIAAEDIDNVDNLNDVIVVVESKDKTEDGDGVFIAYGVKNGLWKSTDTQRANDINGARNIELTSLGGQEEPYSRYIVLSTDYDGTLTMLESLETPPV